MALLSVARPHFVVMLSKSMSNKWYCVESKHGQARLLKAALQLEGFRVHQPMQLVVQPRTRKYSLKPLMGNYLFVLFDVESPSCRHIWHMRDFKQVLGASKYVPTPIPNIQMRFLLAKDYVRKNAIKVGNLIRVVRGHHAGKIGLCEYADGRHVVVLIAVSDERQEATVFDRADVTLTNWVPYA